MTTGTRLTDDWMPSVELLDYARDQGVSDVARMMEDFKDYWIAKAGQAARKTDWNRTWKTWARREGDRQREKAARDARFAKPSQAYQRNAEAAHGAIGNQLFGEDYGSGDEPEYSRWH